jgi:hypothetical protein
MAMSKNAKSALPYARQLIEDEYVQEQLRNAASGLRAAYERARKERARATEDKKLYGHLRETATSIRKAAVALQRPKAKPKRRLRKVTILALAVGGTAMLTLKLQKQQSDTGTPPPPVTPSPEASTA